MTSYGYIIVDSGIISFNLNFIIQLKQFYNIATKVSSRKKCYYFWWFTWLIICSVKFQCVEATDVLKIIPDPKNSCGVDNVTSQHLQRISIITAAPLAHIINQSLCTRTFPDILKQPNLCPCIKKDDPHLVDNYTPIFVLPAISKVLPNYMIICTDINYSIASVKLICPSWHPLN